MALNKVEICGVDTTKLPLLKEEEKKALFEKIKKGDEAAKEEYIKGNLRLVLSVIKRFGNSGENMDDLFQVGCIGLIKAINTFKLEKNIKLATYASRCIENEILMFLRRDVKRKSEVSFDEPLNVDWDGNELLLSDILGTEEDVIGSHLEEEINRKLLYHALSKLSPREKRIMDMRFGLRSGQEMTQKEVADMMGISQSYISRLEKKIIQRLQREVKKLG